MRSEAKQTQKRLIAGFIYFVEEKFVCVLFLNKTWFHGPFSQAIKNKKRSKNLFTLKKFFSTASRAIFVLQSIAQWHQTREWIFHLVVSSLFWMSSSITQSSRSCQQKLNYSILARKLFCFPLLKLHSAFVLKRPSIWAGRSKNNVKLAQGICTILCPVVKKLFIYDDNYFMERGGS